MTQYIDLQDLHKWVDKHKVSGQIHEYIKVTDLLSAISTDNLKVHLIEERKQASA